MSFFRKDLYDAANTTALRAMFRLISQHEEGFKYGTVDPGEVPSESFQVPTGDSWPRESADGIVVFLDPEIYGGTEENPPFYIRSPVDNGWKGILDALIPEQNPCSTSNQDILGLKNIKGRATESYNKLDDDPRLFLDPDCNLETPFNKIHSRNSAAGTEALIYLASRTYFIEQALQAMSAFSKVKPVFDNENPETSLTESNLDDLYFQYVVQKMKDSMEELSTSVGGRSFKTCFSFPQS